MKKITLLLLLLTASFSFGQVVFSEDFNASLTLPAGWSNTDTTSSGLLWSIATGQAAPNFSNPANTLFEDNGLTGNYAIINSDAFAGFSPENTVLETSAFDCSALTNVKLKLNHFFVSGYGGEAHIEVFNGSTWTEVKVYSELTIPEDQFTAGEVVIDVTSELAGVTNAKARFTWVGDYSYYWAIDNIEVLQPEGDAPLAVLNPTPANGATNVSVSIGPAPESQKTIQFSWDAPTTGSPATAFDISVGLTASGNDIGTLTNFESGNSAVYNWAASTTYYWSVTSKNIAGNTTSEVWSFTTEDALGIENNDIQMFSVFPNPASDILNIKTVLTIDQVEVFNQLGQNVLEVKGSNLQNNAIDMSSLQQGMYLVKVSAEGKSQTLKVIKK